MNTKITSTRTISTREKNGKLNTAQLAKIACCTALVACTTMISMPLPMGGYIHPGDATIFVSCFFLGWWAVPAAAIGSALADLLLGYHIFVPATFFIKGVMAAISLLIMGRKSTTLRMLVAFTIASVFMQVAYTLYQFALAFIGYDFLDMLTESFGVLMVSFLLGCLQSVFAIPMGTYAVSRLRLIYKK